MLIGKLASVLQFIKNCTVLKMELVCSTYLSGEIPQLFLTVVCGTFLSQLCTSLSSSRSKCICNVESNPPSESTGALSGSDSYSESRPETVPALEATQQPSPGPTLAFKRNCEKVHTLSEIKNLQDRCKKSVKVRSELCVNLSYTTQIMSQIQMS